MRAVISLSQLFKAMNNRAAIRLVMVIFFTASNLLPALAAESDPVMEALSDEIGRSMAQLHADPHPRPYFVSYLVKDVDEAKMISILGSPAASDDSRTRILVPALRMGDFSLDSSCPNTTRAQYVSKCPLDDEYTATRRAIWLNTDFYYKNIVRDFEWKKAYLSMNNVPDRLPEMTKEPPTVSIAPIEPLQYDKAKWSTQIQQLSELFKKYPALQSSKVEFIAKKITRWITNSEGTRIRDVQFTYCVMANASTQAPDGMTLSDYEIAARQKESELPSLDTLKQDVEALAKRLTDLRQATKADEYCGPVLFEGQAAAEFIAQVLAPNFGMAEDYIPSESWRNPLKNAIGRRILPTHISIVDNPLAGDYKGTPLFGGYKFDDDGVPAQKVSLVENGILKGFCQSRLPTHNSLHSDGHSMGGHGVYDVLEVSSSHPVTRDKMMEQLKDLAKDTGLDYVLVISRMADEFHWYDYPFAGMLPRGYSTPSYSMEPSPPIVAYKLYLADGRKEMLRGLEFRNVSLRAFRDIQAVGDNPAPYLVEPYDCGVRDLVTPSFVIGELELSPAKPDHASPPMIPSPLAMQEKQTAELKK